MSAPLGNLRDLSGCRLRMDGCVCVVENLDGSLSILVSLASESPKIKLGFGDSMPQILSYLANHGAFIFVFLFYVGFHDLTWPWIQHVSQKQVKRLKLISSCNSSSIHMKFPP